MSSAGAAVPTEVEGRRAECGGQLGPDGDQRRAHIGEGRRICVATARYEDSRDPPLVQLSGDLGAGSVNDDDLLARGVELERTPYGRRGDASTELEHDAAHVVYSALSRT